VAVAALVGSGVCVAVDIAVCVASGVWVSVGVCVAVGVAVGVPVGVGVAVVEGVGFTSVTRTAGEAAVLLCWSKANTRSAYTPFFNSRVFQAASTPSSTSTFCCATDSQADGLSPSPTCTS
jgi:hypothetical protein